MPKIVKILKEFAGYYSEVRFDSTALKYEKGLFGRKEKKVRVRKLPDMTPISNDDPPMSMHYLAEDGNYYRVNYEINAGYVLDKPLDIYTVAQAIYDYLPWGRYNLVMRDAEAVERLKNLKEDSVLSCMVKGDTEKAIFTYLASMFR